MAILNFKIFLCYTFYFKHSPCQVEAQSITVHMRIHFNNNNNNNSKKRTATDDNDMNNNNRNSNKNSGKKNNRNIVENSRTFVNLVQIIFSGVQKTKLCKKLRQGPTLQSYKYSKINSCDCFLDSKQKLGMVFFFYSSLDERTFRRKKLFYLYIPLTKYSLLSKTLGNLNTFVTSFATPLYGVIYLQCFIFFSGFFLSSSN